MGIQGLLPFLKDATHRVNVRKYSGYTVAVDTYCWIHRGAFGCAMQLAKGEQTDMYVRYCLKFINMLRSMDIKPILVFDGSHLPAKKAVEESRRERRELYSKKGKQFLREGKVSEARDCFTKCVNVTPHMALDVIKAARSLDVDCIVAPYEADAQLAFLAISGIVQAVITEDSDLVPFGCPRIIYKLDLNGNGLEIEASRLNRAMKMGNRFSIDKFRYMCIASGCDYLASLPGIGLGKSRKLFQAATNPDITHVLKQMPIHLKMKLTVPPEYITGFHQANNTFLYQLVYDPIKRRLVPLQPYSDDVDTETLTYAGPYYPSDLALQQALGNIDHTTKKQIWDFKPQYKKPYDKSVPRHRLSIWHKDYRPGPVFSEEDKVEVQRHTTNGKEVALVSSGLKLDGQRRKRPRPDAAEDIPSNDDLTSIYSSPNAKRHSAGKTLLVPDTPESKDKEPVKASPRRRNPFSREGSHGRTSPPKRVIGFGAEDRVLKTLSRRNIFAKGQTRASSRLDVLRGNTVVTSRFFSTKPDQTFQETAKEVEEKECLPLSQLSSIDEMSDSIDETINQDMISGKDDTHKKTSMEGHEGPVMSTVNRLQRFQRSTSAPALPFTQSKPTSSVSPKESVNECGVGSEDFSGVVQPGLNSESDHLNSQENSQEHSQGCRMSTQIRTGAFSWSSSSSSVTSLKREGSTRNFKSLSDFRRKTVKTKLERGGCQNQKQSGDLESSQEGMSQGSCKVSLASQQSNLCSIDTDSLSFSQFSSQSFDQDNCRRSDTQSPCFEMEVNSSKIESLQEVLPIPTSNTEQIPDGHEQNQDMTTDTHDQRLQQTKQMLIETQKHRKTSESEECTSPGGANSNQDDVRQRGSDEVVSSLEKEEEEFIDLTSESDDNAPSTDGAHAQTGKGQMKKMKQDPDSGNTPKLPTCTLPKMKPGSTKLSQCRASGLSRRQKSKQLPKADENGIRGSRQQTLFAFMKKSHERRNDATMPLSPSKENVICDVTPEGDNSICSKGIVRAQRNIFK